MVSALSITRALSLWPYLVIINITEFLDFPMTNRCPGHVFDDSGRGALLMKRFIGYFYLFGIFVIAAVITGLIVQYWQSYQVIARNTEKITVISASVVDERIHGWLAKNGRVIEITRDYTAVHHADHEELLAFMTLMLDNNPDFDSIYYGSVDNAMVNASGWSMPPGFDLRTRPWYVKAVSEGRLVYSEAFVNASNDKVIVTVAAPVYDREGILLGVVSGDVSLKTIVDMVQMHKAGESGFSFLVDGKGNILAHPEYQYHPGTPFTNIHECYHELGDIIVSGSEGIMPVTLNETDGYIAYQSIPETDWHLASFVPLSEYASQRYQLVSGLFISLAVSLVIILMFLWLHNRFMIAPMVRLGCGIENIDIENNTRYRLPVEDAAGFAGLADSINRVLDKTGDFLNSLAVKEKALEQANQQLAVSENKYRNLIDNSYDIVYSLDPGGLFTFVSPSVALLLGWQPEEVIGQPIEKFLHPDDAARAREVVRKTVETGQPHVGSGYRIRHKDGSWRWHRSNSMPLLDENGRIIGFEGNATDITELKRLQEIMIQTEKMMSVGGLAAGMAHELNNPLSGILQSVQNMENRLLPDLKLNQEAAADCGTSIEAINAYLKKRGIFRFIEGIRSSGQRAAAIISNMLQFSRRSGQDKAPVSLSALIDETIELAANDFDPGTGYDFLHIDIDRQYDPALPDVNCAAAEIQQVILNLLINAAQAMNENSHQVEKPAITVRTFAGNGMAVIEVEDNGPAMSEDVRQRIFEPFYTTKPPGAGTGLGLSVSYYIVTQNHQGQMYVESIRGKGNKVSIHLPL